MSKNLQALLEGYVLFDVNGERFATYEAARARRMQLTELGLPVAFKGLNIPRQRWEYFFISVYPIPAAEVLISVHHMRPDPNGRQKDSGLNFFVG